MLVVATSWSLHRDGTHEEVSRTASAPMHTYSHFLVTAALQGPLKSRTATAPSRLPAARTGALLLGSILPDLPLTLVAIFTIARDFFSGAFAMIDFESLEPGAPIPQEWLDASMTMRLFDIWFFENPWMMAAHNLFHSPLLLALYIGVAYSLWRRKVFGAGWFFWLACAAMLHTLIDIPLHVEDGPLVFFPLNWSYRYRAPISYWDSEHGGAWWTMFEHSMDALLLLFLGWRYALPWARGLRASRSTHTTVK